MPPAPDSKEDQGKKLFVGGIHYKTEEQSLREYFSQFGEITDVVVMKDSQTGKPRGFGFITFTDSAAVDAAQSGRPHNLDGKDIDTKRAMPREESSPEVHAAVKKVFVGALKKNVTSEDIHNYFSNFGSVVDAQVVMSKETNESRGFAFVTFDDTDAVDKVILARPHMLNESKIDVRKALNKDEMGKMRPRAPRIQQQQWNQGAPDYRQQNWNQNYNNQNYPSQNYPPAQNYSYQQESYGNGYNYENAAPQQTWDYPPNPVDGNFGNYAQQPYSGGPIRSNAPYTRPTPYGGPNSWQQH